MTITTDLEPVPSRQSPSTFSERMDTWLGKISTWTSEANSTASDVNTDAANASTSASNAASSETNAQAAQTAAESASNATSWSSVTTYDAGDVVYGTDSRSYRSSQDSNTNHNPVGDDGTWWVLLGGIQNGDPLDMQDSLLTRPKLKDYSEVINVLGDLAGGTDDIDLEDGNVVTATVSTATQTFTFSNPAATGSNCGFTLFLTNGGSQTINWPASVDWVDATAPTLTAAGIDVLVFTTNDAGTTWYGFVVGLDVK